MRTLIAVPCMDMLHAAFASSLVNMRRVGDVDCEFKISSLIYSARNMLLQNAISGGYDRILWLDSDMQFAPDLMERLDADINDGKDIVTGLYFTRKQPIKPTIFSECAVYEFEPGKKSPIATAYEPLPEEGVFKVKACGFGCVMMTVDAAKAVTDKFGIMPFMPVAGWGEDLSFCLRAEAAGVDIWCDSRIKLGHVGQAVYTDAMYHTIQDTMKSILQTT